MSKEPLIEKISEYLEQGFASFHTPGHQQGRGLAESLEKLFGAAAKADLTEVWELDNLKNPRGCLQEAQALTARLFGSVRSYFLVNGSTVGLQAGLLALNTAAGIVLLPRNAHLSVLNGLVLSGGCPVGVPTVTDAEWGLPLGVKAETWRYYLEQISDVDCLVALQPSYQGVGRDIAEVLGAARAYNVPLLVDEAHGAHLFFKKEHIWSAQRNKADLVVHSVHKTLGALTQASLLHINTATHIPQVERALSILQTSSPSYLLMASLDGVQAQMERAGSLLAEKTQELAAYLRSGIRKIKGYRIFEPDPGGGWFQDPGKIVLSAAGLGLTGWELASLLRQKYGVMVEQAASYYVLFLITLGHTRQSITELLQALRDIAQSKIKGQGLPPAAEDLKVLWESEIRPVLTPRQVFTSRKEEVVFQEGRGRIAAEPWTVYPPGIPAVWPGQIIRDEHVEYLKWACRSGLFVEGLSADGKVRVVSES